MIGKGKPISGTANFGPKANKKTLAPVCGFFTRPTAHDNFFGHIRPGRAPIRRSLFFPILSGVTTTKSDAAVS